MMVDLSATATSAVSGAGANPIEARTAFPVCMSAVLNQLLWFGTLHTRNFTDPSSHLSVNIASDRLLSQAPSHPPKLAKDHPT